MRLLSNLAIVALAVAPVIATAQTAPTAAAPATSYSTGKTTIGMLFNDPAAKAVLTKYIPTVVANPQISQGFDMTLKDVQQYLPELTDKVLADIDTDLAKLPVKK